MTGAPGVALTGIGPGAAAAVNGMAYAYLEQAPVIAFTDCQHEAGSLHQSLDQRALLAPITKLSTRLGPADWFSALARIFDAAVGPPKGPVHVDISSPDAMSPVEEAPAGAGPEKRGEPDHAQVGRARALIGRCRKPVVIVGLEARERSAAAALRSLVEGLDAAVMPTYKAKGVFPDDKAATIGHFTGARAEAECVGGADLIVLFGVDPVEFIPGAWPYEAAIIEMSVAAGYRLPRVPDARLIGPLDAAVEALGALPGASGWGSEELRDLKQRYRRRLSLDGPGHTAQSITRSLLAAAPAGTRLTVDAGAHMFSVFAEWQADAPFGVMKSNGLSTMGFALPAAIASACCEPGRPVAAITGDGGLMMTLGELATAARLGADMVVVVVNDASLSLIDIKQQRQQRPSRGVRTPRSDFAAAARAMGCRGLSVASGEDLDAALKAAFAETGPAVVDVEASPDGYGEQLEALRG